MTGPAARASDVISFGPYSLVASERLLTKDGTPVELGARALDILIALTSRPNEAVSKRDLLARVWPDVTVEEGSLRFHIARLRKALGDGKDGARYIATLAGRGYCLVAPLLRPKDPVAAAAAESANIPHANLPGRLPRMVGRADDVLTVSKLLVAERFVTIVGTGGVGKTTVAVAVAHELIDAFAGAVLFVDLGLLSAPDLTGTAVASMLGLPVRSDDATPSLIAYLRDKRILLVLDTCEHLVDAVAPLTARIYAAALQVHILATSREALRVEGDHVYTLEPLAFPPDDAALTAAAARTFPAFQVFMERAAASGARLDVNDADASVVADICRKLGGVALAIELAAGRVVAYGLQQTAALLDQRLTLLWPGQRTAPPRQKTLHATFEWSYALLSDTERAVLRRLAVFVGPFTMDAALAVLTSASIDQSLVFSAVDSLVAKSMLATRPAGGMMRYRLLDTTRAYALEIAIPDAELAELAARHAVYYRDWLRQIGAEAPSLSAAAERLPLLTGLNNVRAALEWSFGPCGNVEIAVGLAAAAAPVLLAMSLLSECLRWSERALIALDPQVRAGPEEMQLQAALGMSLMFVQGGCEAAHAALTRALDIAEASGNSDGQLGLLTRLVVFYTRTGDFNTMLAYAKRGIEVARKIADPAAMALARAILGMSLRHTGDQAGARTELEAALAHGRVSPRTSSIYLGYDHYSLASITLAITLWMQGHPAQALQRARQTVEDPETSKNPVTLAMVLSWAVCVFIWAGEFDSAEDYSERFIAHAASLSIRPYLAVGRGFKGVLAIRRGDARGGIVSVEGSLAALKTTRHGLMDILFGIALAQGFAATGRVGDARTLIDETIRHAETNGALSLMPELLRVKGTVLLSWMPPDAGGAERCFVESLDLSRRQATRSWELRTAVDLAALWAAEGRNDRARSLLRPLFEQFVEGFETADLKAARNLLAALG